MLAVCGMHVFAPSNANLLQLPRICAPRQDEFPSWRPQEQGRTDRTP